MTVYVDDMRASFGRMVMCHMIADTTDELLAMVDQIGINQKWIQYPGKPKEHFDIALLKADLNLNQKRSGSRWILSTFPMF